MSLSIQGGWCTNKTGGGEVSSKKPFAVAFDIVCVLNRRTVKVCCFFVLFL